MRMETLRSCASVACAGRAVWVSRFMYLKASSHASLNAACGMLGAATRCRKAVRMLLSSGCAIVRPSTGWARPNKTLDAPRFQGTTDYLEIRFRKAIPFWGRFHPRDSAVPTPGLHRLGIKR